MDKERQTDLHNRINDNRFRMLDRADYILSLELEKPMPNSEIVSAIGGLRLALYGELLHAVDRAHFRTRMMMSGQEQQHDLNAYDMIEVVPDNIDKEKENA